MPFLWSFSPGPLQRYYTKNNLNMPLPLWKNERCPMPKSLSICVLCYIIINWLCRHYLHMDFSHTALHIISKKCWIFCQGVTIQFSLSHQHYAYGYLTIMCSNGNLSLCLNFFVVGLIQNSTVPYKLITLTKIKDLLTFHHSYYKFYCLVSWLRCHCPVRWVITV